MKKMRFLVSLMTKNNDYQLEQAAAAQQAAAQWGVDLQVVFADNDPITQSTQVLKAGERGSESALGRDVRHNSAQHPDYHAARAVDRRERASLCHVLVAFEHVEQDSDRFDRRAK